MSGVSIKISPFLGRKGEIFMENLMMSIIAGVIASYIYDKLKNHSERPMNYTPLRRQLKYVKLSKTRRVLLCLKLKYH